MKRFVLCLAAGSLALLVLASTASAFGWKDVLKMHRAGIADSLIVQKIEYSGKTFHLGADEMEALAEAGVSDSVISAMLQTEAEDGTEDGYSYYHPYYPHSRLYVGWDYYYPRYRGYYARGYYPYYGYYGGYRYPRSYDSYRRYRGGDYGSTRERTRVENRIDSRSRSGAESRTRTQTRPYSSPRHDGAGTRTRTR